jgi:hypothetical protein
MYQHQIDNPDLMVSEMSGDGAEPQVGHLDDPMKIVGRIRHGQEQYLQGYFLLNPWLMMFGLQT